MLFIRRFCGQFESDQRGQRSGGIREVVDDGRRKVTTVRKKTDGQFPRKKEKIAADTDDTGRPAAGIPDGGILRRFRFSAQKTTQKL